MRLLLWIFLFLGTITVKAEVSPKPVLAKKHLNLRTDSSKIELREIDRVAIKNYSKQKDFIYDDVAPASRTWWDRFWDWVGQLLKKVFVNRVGGTILKYFLIGSAVAIVVFIVIKLIGLDFKVLTGKSKSIEVPFEESLENIHEINFDEQIVKALQAENYRLAVRLLYLKTLKHLSDQEIIEWLPEKTNQAYISEIQEPSKAEFAELTLQFEYIWYGEFFIDKNSFEKINQSFHQFNQITR
jgi:hypothetical protein